MARRPKRHRISVQVKEADSTALDELCAVADDVRRSDVIRAALRLGIAQLKKDPSKVYTTPPPGRVERLRARPLRA